MSTVAAIDCGTNSIKVLVGDVRADGTLDVVLRDSRVVRLQRLHPRSIAKAPISTILVPRPQTSGFPVNPVSGVALLEWARGVIDDVIDVPAPASATTKE